MIPVHSATQVWIATAVNDMHCGMNSLALLVQEGFRRDSHAGDLYVFRERRAEEESLAVCRVGAWRQARGGVYTLIQTACLVSVDPQAWLGDVIARINEHPARGHNALLCRN